MSFHIQQILKILESIANRRYVFFSLVDLGDGHTPELGEAGGQPNISINGAAYLPTSNVLVHIGSGSYYVELDRTTELDSLGFALVRYESVNVRSQEILCSIVAYDPWRSGYTTVQVSCSYGGPCGS